MASVKVVLLQHKVLSNGEHPLWLRIIKDRKTSYKALGYSSRLEWWDLKSNKPGKKHPNQFELEILINKKVADTRKLIMEAEIEEKDYSAEELVSRSVKKIQKSSVYSYFNIVITRLKDSHRIGNAQAYKDSLSALKRFRGNKDLAFTDIDVNLLNRFEEYLLEKEISEISISVYMRTLRSIFNKAIQEEYVKQDNYPFDKYKISRLNTNTKKRAITKDQIKMIISLDLEKETNLWHCKNYFLFSYYNMGITLIDIGYLKRTNIENGRLRYNRQKTGKEYNVKILTPALEILSHYADNQLSEYIFPILNSNIHITSQQQKYRIQKVNKQVNRGLKEIASLCGIDIKLTTYVARHSWATILKRNGVSTSVISEAMKHDTEKTTQVYLDSFE